MDELFAKSLHAHQGDGVVPRSLILLQTFRADIEYPVVLGAASGAPLISQYERQSGKAWSAETVRRGLFNPAGRAGSWNCFIDNLHFVVPQQRDVSSHPDFN
jgi:hypothetical protein